MVKTLPTFSILEYLMSWIHIVILEHIIILYLYTNITMIHVFLAGCSASMLLWFLNYIIHIIYIQIGVSIRLKSLIFKSHFITIVIIIIIMKAKKRMLLLLRMYTQIVEIKFEKFWFCNKLMSWRKEAKLFITTLISVKYYLHDRQLLYLT